MSIDVNILGPAGSTLKRSAIYDPLQKGRQGDPGLLVYNQDANEYVGAAFPLTDETGSAEMAVDATSGGTPENVYIDDPTTNWTNTALGGTWDFASAAVTPQGGTECIDATGTIDGNQFQIERSSVISLASYVSFSGYVYLDSWNDSRHSIQLQVLNGGVAEGVEVNINDYIDTGITGAWQQFNIVKSDLGLDAQNIDQLVFTTSSTAGAPPNYYLDTINIEETGLRVFSVKIPQGIKFELFSVNFTFLDDVTVVEPDQLLGAGSLANGIIIRVIRGGRTGFQTGIKNFADLSSSGSTLDSIITGTSDTLVTHIAFSPELTRLDGDNGDEYSFLLQDDLSALTSFKALLRGRIVI